MLLPVVSDGVLFQREVYDSITARAVVRRSDGAID